MKSNGRFAFIRAQRLPQPVGGTHQLLIFLDEAVRQEEAQRFHNDQNKQRHGVKREREILHSCGKELLEDDVRTNPENQQQRNQEHNHGERDRLHLFHAVIVTEDGETRQSGRQREAERQVVEPDDRHAVRDSLFKGDGVIDVIGRVGGKITQRYENQHDGNDCRYQ